MGASQSSDPVADAPLQSGLDSEIDTSGDWLYSVDVQSGDLDGLLTVAVTVKQNVPANKRPVSVTLRRWMVDPTIEMETEE